MPKINLSDLRLGRRFNHASGTRCYFSFEDIESMVVVHRGAVAAQGYARIVAIARGGLYPATLLSQLTGIPLSVANFERSTRIVTAELGPPVHGSERLLVVDDIAGLGFTLSSTVAHFSALGWQCDTFTLAWDDFSRMRPTYGLQLQGERAVWPWERGIVADSFSADRAGADPDRWRMGFDLDGVFLADVPHELYLSDLPRALATRAALPAYAHRPEVWRNDGEAFIVSARLSSEQSETEAWLARYGIRAAGVFLRPSLEERPSAFKARTIEAKGITEFVESELEQACEIAALVPYCVVWHYDAAQPRLTRVS